MAKPQKKIEAQKLRKEGKSIKEIATQLSVSKGSVSHWCKNITLTKSQLERLKRKQKRAGTKALIEAAEKKKKDRIAKTKKLKSKGHKSVGALSERDLFIAGLALYWGEGYKKGNGELGLTNSDPEVIKLFIKWMQKIYNIPSKRFTLRVSINSIHKDRENEVLQYWSKVTNLPMEQFTKTSFIKTKPKKEYKNKKNHYGTLRAKVKRGTDLRREILGAISALEVEL